MVGPLRIAPMSLVIDFVLSVSAPLHACSLPRLAANCVEKSQPQQAITGALTRPFDGGGRAGWWVNPLARRARTRWLFRTAPALQVRGEA
jgi:hypothetical protein